MQNTRARVQPRSRSEMGPTSGTATGRTNARRAARWPAAKLELRMARYDTTTPTTSIETTPTQAGVARIVPTVMNTYPTAARPAKLTARRVRLPGKSTSTSSAMVPKMANNGVWGPPTCTAIAATIGTMIAVRTALRSASKPWSRERAAAGSERSRRGTGKPMA